MGSMYIDKTFIYKTVAGRKELLQRDLSDELKRPKETLM